MMTTRYLPCMLLAAATAVRAACGMPAPVASDTEASTATAAAKAAVAQAHDSPRGLVDDGLGKAVAFGAIVEP